MVFHDVKITNKGGTGAGTVVEVDGVEMDGVTRLDYRCSLDSINTVELSLASISALKLVARLKFHVDQPEGIKPLIGAIINQAIKDESLDTDSRACLGIRFVELLIENTRHLNDGKEVS